MSEHVILLHGLWMRGFTLTMLRHRLQHAGYSVESFDYASVTSSPDVGVERLLQRVREKKNGKIHFVGHSLGGLIALHALQREPQLIDGKVVCLGTPLRGSAVARGVAKLPGGSFVIGKSLPILRDGIERWEGAQPTGSIAGPLISRKIETGLCRGRPTLLIIHEPSGSRVTGTGSAQRTPSASTHYRLPTWSTTTCGDAAGPICRSRGPS